MSRERRVTKDEISWIFLFSIQELDTLGTAACAHEHHSHSRMKHIDIRRAHFIRDLVNGRLIDVHHIPGAQNPADLLAFHRVLYLIRSSESNRSLHQTSSLFVTSCDQYMILYF